MTGFVSLLDFYIGFTRKDYDDDLTYRDAYLKAMSQHGFQYQCLFENADAGFYKNLQKEIIEREETFGEWCGIRFYNNDHSWKEYYLAFKNEQDMIKARLWL